MIVEDDFISVPIKPHPQNFWQVEATRYSFDYYAINRKTNIIFSSTIEDIVLPLPLFKVITKFFIAKTVVNNSGRTVYQFDCSIRLKGPSLYITINRVAFEIHNRQYVYDNRHTDNDDKCYLKFKPGNDQDIILGTAFNQAYGVCFFPKDKKVTLQKVEGFNKDVAKKSNAFEFVV